MSSKRLPAICMRLFFSSILTLLLSSIILSTQGQNTYVPKIIPPSPNAAALMKFTEVPVSHYTGTASATVPIHTILLKGMQVPVSLNYHTGGIKVKEEAGWVGLGWALSAGGIISKTIMDEDDFAGNKTYFTSVVPQLQGDISSIQNDGFVDPPNVGVHYREFLCNYKVNTTTGTADYSTPLSMYPSPYDFEPDIYHYSFLDKNGSFMITRDRKVVLQNQDNIKVEFENNGNSFTITDERGNRFYFKDKEYTMSATGALSTLVTSAWYLSKIVTAQQDSVMFHYYNDNTFTSVPPEYYEIMQLYCGNGSSNVLNNAGTMYTNNTLQRIEFAEGELQFTFDNIRSDLKEGRKLNTIKLFASSKGSLDYKKEFRLYYSYFPTPAGSDTLDHKRLRLDSVKEMSGSTVIPPYAFTYNEPQNMLSYLGKRSYSIDHWGYFNGASNGSYTPELSVYYNPPKAGYGPNSPPALFTRLGANRKANASYMTAFSLTQIRYPTGGKTVFEYEANDYDPGNSRTGPVDFPNFEEVTVTKTIGIWDRGTTTGPIDLRYLTPIAPEGTGTTNLEMIVAFRSSNNDGNVHYRNSFGRIYFRFLGQGFNVLEDIGSNNLTCNSQSPVCSVVLPLSISNSAGPYSWEAYIDPTIDFTYFQDIRITLIHKEVKQIHDNNNGIFTEPAGGLRVKTITDYADDNTIAKQRSYEYNYYDGAKKYSYGRLMSTPSYVRYVGVQNGAGGTCNNLTVMGTSQTALTSIVHGNIVGYSQVTEYAVDPRDNSNTGKTVYSYVNSPDTTLYYYGFRFPGMPNIGNHLNGSILSKKVYARAGSGYQLASENYNYFHAANRNIYFSLKTQTPPSGTSGYSGSACITGSTTSVNMLACLYPSIKSERLLLDSTKEIIYDQYDPAKAITKVKSFYYDNTGHYMTTRMVTSDSKQNRVSTTFKYPQDYLPAGSTATGNTVLDGLISRNMVAEVIERRDSLFYPGSSSGMISGAQLSNYKELPSNAMVTDAQSQLNIPSPVTNFQAFAINGNNTTQDSRYEKMISFDRYDNANNLIQYTSLNHGPVSILWDYGNHLPVCEVKNAVVDNIAYTSFEAEGSGNWIIGSSTRIAGGITGNSCYQLGNGGITKTGLTSGITYIVSYWTTSNTPFTINGSQGTVFKGKTVNGWTYYEHKVSGVTQAALPQTGGLIDELRLYPADAQMTSFTYAPLIGTTSNCSSNNTITYYEYDALGRLQVTRDQDGNIIKTIEYHYQGQ